VSNTIVTIEKSEQVTTPGGDSYFLPQIKPFDKGFSKTSSTFHDDSLFSIQRRTIDFFIVDETVCGPNFSFLLLPHGIFESIQLPFASTDWIIPKHSHQTSLSSKQTFVIQPIQKVPCMIKRMKSNHIRMQHSLEDLFSTFKATQYQSESFSNSPSMHLSPHRKRIN